jgi:hypothetical protein
MKKICLEAIEVTSTLATTTDRRTEERARDRFFELYYASMYIIELHQRKQSGDRSSIEASMVRFARMLNSVESPETPLPHASLCTQAREVRNGCVEHLRLTAPESCR